MALTGWADANYISHGSAAALDDMTAGTVAFWLQSTSATARQTVLWKEPNWESTLAEHQATPDWYLFIGRATTAMFVRAAVSAFAAYGTSKWMFFVATWDFASSANCRLLIGDVSTPAAEPSSYLDQVAGSGSTSPSNAANNWTVGRNFSSSGRQWVGPIAAHWAFNKALSLAEIQQLQWRGRIADWASCLIYSEYGWNGTGSQPDWSGHGNAGTIAGTLTLADHAPRRSPFAWSRGWSPPSAVAGSATRSDTDSIFMKSERTSIVELNHAVDKLFLSDARVSDLSRHLVSSLLIIDVVDRLRMVEHRVVDSILLADAALRVIELLRNDGLFLDESADIVRTGEIIRFALDSLLLFDIVSTSPRSLLQQDGLLLSDAHFRQTIRLFVSSLLATDQRISALEKSSTDKTFLIDTALAERLSGAAASAVDPILLSDVVTKIIQAQHGDNALLNDAAILGKEIARELFDSMLLLDRRAQSERNITQFDAVVIHDLARYLREILQLESLIVNEAAAAQWFPTVVEFLTYAVLSSGDPLGVQVSARDPLTRRFGVTKWRTS